jgi:hypothetical protein
VTVHKFERRELDEQIRTALEQLHESEGILSYLRELSMRLRSVYEVCHTGIKPGAASMLAEDIDSLEQEIQFATDAVENWRNILDVLRKRTA